jgi:hypothetical protein
MAKQRPTPDSSTDDSTNDIHIPARLDEIKPEWCTSEGAPDIDLMPFGVAVRFLMDDEGMTFTKAFHCVAVCHREAGLLPE